jgi:hypothetical protein
MSIDPVPAGPAVADPRGGAPADACTPPPALGAPSGPEARAPLDPLRQRIVDQLRGLAQPGTLVAPTKAAFIAAARIPNNQLIRAFGSYQAAIAAAGLRPRKRPGQFTREGLLAEFGQAVRQAGRLPTQEGFGRSHCPLSVVQRLFASWHGLQQAFVAFARPQPQWADVLELLALRPLPPLAELSLSDPLAYPWMRHAPTCELGVAVLFGMLAPTLGFAVEAVDKAFPDCTALCMAGPGDWRRVRIEFEFESRNFATHGHPPEGCDVIVCWRHNWIHCPAQLTVIALEEHLPR